MGSAAPLMTLRDLLELACESSCSDGFRSYPRRLLLPACPAANDAVQAKAADADVPVRLLIKAGLRRSPSRTLSSILFPRTRSPGPGSVATISRLTRSLSRRLVFWRRHRGDDDVEGSWSGSDERDSLGLPSPVVSSCSASECSEHAESVAEAADPPAPEEQQSDESEKASPSTSSACAETADDANHGAAAGDGPKASDGDPMGGSLVSMEENKQQLSPVSIMDFPFHDEDDVDERSDAGTCSPSFQECQHDLELSNSAPELLHKIQRPDALAEGVDPVNLEPRFVASDESGPSTSDDTQTHTNSSTDHDSSSATSTTLSSESDEQHRTADDGEREPDELHHRRLLAQLLKDDESGAAATSEERLLLDFLAEGLAQLRESKAGPVVGAVRPSDHDRDESALVRAAEEWARGAGERWGVEDVLFAGPAALADMDRERRWMCVGEEEREVGAAVGELLLDALLAELVCDMAVR